jgi:phytoene synthase
VAGTIGLMTCPIFGVSDPDALQHADDLGIAMQLTNICRDVWEDAENDRIYLPADFFGTSPSVSDLLSKDSKWIEETVLVKRRLLSLAEERYASGEAGIGYLPFRMRIVVRWAGRMYREIGELIRNDPTSYHSQRAVVKSGKKLRILLPSLGRAFLPRSS